MQRDFQTHVGMSPRQYIERVRLARAHTDLAANIDDSVADIAYRWGFGHVPRFAARYRERYGVVPSHTRENSRFWAVEPKGKPAELQGRHSETEPNTPHQAE